MNGNKLVKTICSTALSVICILSAVELAPTSKDWYGLAVLALAFWWLGTREDGDE